MRLKMRQKFLSARGDSLIEDESGNLVYKINGRFLQIIARRFTISDHGGKELARLTRRLLALGLVFDVKCSDGRSASIRQHQLAAFCQRFSIRVQDGPGYEVTSDLNAHVFTFRQGGMDLAKVSQKWFSVSNTWEIEIDDGIEPLFILASAIVFDAALH